MLTFIQNYLQEHEQAFLRDLASLVNLDCGTYNKIGVDTAGVLMSGMLGDAGFSVERIPLNEYGDCIVGRLAGQGSTRIMLLGHLDTVYPDGTAEARPMRIEGDRVVGPGTCDMKGGLLAGLYAVRALMASGFQDFGEIVFFCNSEEEIGSPQSHLLYAEAAGQADAVLVLEAARANGAVVSARKGSGIYRLSVSGVAAHAGVAPERGANAILALSHYIQALQALNGLRPGLTVNVGVVQGGTRPNVVPDNAEALVDVRVMLPEDIEALDAAIHEAVAVTHLDHTSATVSGGVSMPPMAQTAATVRLADLAREVAGELGFDLDHVGTGGASDANFVSVLGTPVLDGLGPIGQMAHSPDEYLLRSSVVPRTALLAGLIGRLAAAGS